MNKTLIYKTPKTEQALNSRILEAFKSAYSSKDVQNVKHLLHDHGRYFGKMNKEMVAGYFYGILMGQME